MARRTTAWIWLTAAGRVSGTVFLLPVQASVLDVPNPALTPTNLLYNLIATPGRCCGPAATSQSSTR